MNTPRLSIWIVVLHVCFCTLTANADKLTVKVEKASVFAAPNAGAKVLSVVGKRRTLESAGEPEKGFYPVKTKSGRKVFVKASDVEVEQSSIDDDLVSSESEEKPKSFRRFRFDGGGSIGSSNRGSFQEVNLGVSYYVLEWLIWRNAPFFRFQSGASNSYGLDSSIRGQYAIPAAPDFSPAIALGAGFRFINTGRHAPFAEVGLGARVSEVSIQLGVKYIVGKWVDESSENEMIFNGGFTASGSF